MFIFGILCFLLAVAALVAAFVVSDEPGPGGVAAACLAIVGALCWTAGSYNRVPTRNVGIVTSFGKATGETTGPGLHWTKPWQDIDDWDASSQTYDRLGENCLWVSIAAQRRACVPVQIEWNAKGALKTEAKQAAEAWSQYKETTIHGEGKSRFETFTYRRVNPQIDAAITSVFAAFDPLGSVNKTTGDAPAPDLNAAYRAKVRTAIVASLGEDITIHSIAFATPRYDDPTTAAIAAYGQKVLEARNLAVDSANAATRNQVADKTGVPAAVQQCLDIASAKAKEPGLCLGASVNLIKQLG